MSKIIEWIKANPWKAAVIALAILVVVAGGFGYGCGYIKGGCNAEKKAEEKK